MCDSCSCSFISFFLVVWNDIGYFAIIGINDCWIIFTFWIWNASCVYIALFRLACLLNFVCTSPLIFHLIVNLSCFVFAYLVCCSWLIRHLGFLCLAHLAKLDHFLALQRIHMSVVCYCTLFVLYICLIV